MKKLIKLIYLIFTAFLFSCTNLTDGNRNFVDNQSTFVVGKDSSLKIGNVDNTASIIGTTDNGKIAIENYTGKNLENSDKLKTVGGSVGTSGAGFNYSNSEKEGIARNTVIGNVSINNSTGDTINRDLSKANEIRRDSSMSTNVYDESQLINAATNPNDFKEKIDLANQELKDLKNVVLNTIENKGKDNRNFIELLNNQRRGTSLNNLLGNDIKNILESSNNIQKDFSALIENFGKDLGIDIKVNYTNTAGMPLESKDKDGTARIDGKEVGIYINTDKVTSTSELVGTMFEELSHIIDGIADRQDEKIVKTTDEKGLESLGRPINDYFKEQYSENSKEIELKSEGDFTFAKGMNVGDKKNEGWNIYKLDIRTQNQANRQFYNEKEIQEKINDIFGKGSFNIDWKKYETDSDYREQTNYYYFQAKYFVKINTLDKITDTYIDITQTNGKKLRLTKVPATEAILHNMKMEDKIMYFYFNENYRKYVNEDGFELILDKNNKPVYDPLIVGTYNFYTYEKKISYDGIMHGKVDVGLYKKYGTGPNDPTTKEDRVKISGYFAAEISFLTYSMLKSETNLKNKENLSYDEIKEFWSKKINESIEGNENFGVDINEK